jgi:hypothetical protein
VSAVLAVAQGTVWEHQHDEGTTFDLSIGIVQRGELVPDQTRHPATVESLYKTVEGNSAYNVQDVVDSVSVPDYRMFHPPGYYVLLHVWTKIFGTSNVLLRLPAYILAALAILGMVRIARRVIPGENAGVWVALIFGLSPWVLRITNFARPYHLALFCAVWATVCVVSMRDDKNRRFWRVLFVLLSVLGMYTLYHYAFVLAWHLALMAWEARSARPERRRAEIFGLYGVLLAILLGFGPWLRNFYYHIALAGNSDDYFIGAVAPVKWYFYLERAYQDFAISDAVRTYFGQELRVISLALGSITLIVAIWAFAGPARRALDQHARRFWLSAALLPLLLLASDVVLGNHTIFITKLSFGLIVLLVLVVVYAWLAVPIAWLRYSGLTCWALLLAASVSFNTYSKAAIRSDMEAAAAAIAQADTNYHLIVLSTDLRGYSVPFLLSLRDAGVRNVFVTQANKHEDLSALLVEVDNGYSSRFSRVSLVNFQIPTQKNRLMWDMNFVKENLVAIARPKWRIFWHDLQQWSGEDAIGTKDRQPDNSRELWVFGPVKAKFYASPITTDEESAKAL